VCVCVCVCATFSVTVDARTDNTDLEEPSEYGDGDLKYRIEAGRGREGEVFLISHHPNYICELRSARRITSLHVCLVNIILIPAMTSRKGRGLQDIHDVFS